MEQHFALRALPHTRLVVQKSPNMVQIPVQCSEKVLCKFRNWTPKASIQRGGSGDFLTNPCQAGQYTPERTSQGESHTPHGFSQLHFLLTCIVCSAWESHVLLCHVTKKIKLLSFVGNTSNYYLQLDLNIVLNKCFHQHLSDLWQNHEQAAALTQWSSMGEYVNVLAFRHWGGQHIGKQLSNRGKGEEPNEVRIKAQPPPSRGDLDSLATWHKMLKHQTWRFFSICNQLFQDFCMKHDSIIGTFINPFKHIHIALIGSVLEHLHLHPPLDL